MPSAASYRTGTGTDSLGAFFQQAAVLVVARLFPGDSDRTGSWPQRTRKGCAVDYCTLLSNSSNARQYYDRFSRHSQDRVARRGGARTRDILQALGLLIGPLSQLTVTVNAITLQTPWRAMTCGWGS